MTIATLVRRGIVALRSEAQYRRAPRTFQDALQTANRRIDEKLPQGARPVETALKCYRMVGVGQCNEPLYKRPSGEFICYVHGRITR